MIRAKINVDYENNRKDQQTKREWHFEKINKICRSLAILPKAKKKDDPNNIKNERGDIKNSYCGNTNNHKIL